MNEKNISEDNKVKRRALRRTNKGFWLFTLGFLLCLGSFSALATLQSSINIEESVGTMTLGVAYLVSILVSVFLTPIAIRRFGSKWVMIFGELTYLLYTAANFYPKMYVMLIAGVLVGAGEGFIWTALPLYCWHFGYLRGQIKTKSYEFYVQKYVAMFWGMFQISQIFGNAISYAVLFGGRNQTEGEEYIINVTRTESDLTSYDVYQYCGKNDCQNANATEENIDQYVPPAYTLYILISIFFVLILCGLGVHIRFLPNAILNTSEDTQPKVISVDVEEEKLSTENDDVKIQLKIPSFKSTLWATTKHAVEPKQILITPLVICTGLITTFVYSEGLRSYAACILGVEQIGAVVIVLAVSSGISSAVSDKLIGKYGRNYILLAALIINISSFLFCLFWPISEGSKYLVYAIYVMFGLSESLWRNCSMDIYTWYYPYNQEISYNVWNIWSTFGFAFGFLWSPVLCTGTKIYFQIGFLLLSAVCYGFAECIYKKGNSTASSENK